MPTEPIATLGEALGGALNAIKAGTEIPPIGPDGEEPNKPAPPDPPKEADSPEKPPQDAEPEKPKAAPKAEPKVAPKADPDPPKHGEIPKNPHLEMAEKPPATKDKEPTEKEIRSWEEAKAANATLKKTVAATETELETIRAELSTIRAERDTLAGKQGEGEQNTALLDELKGKVTTLESELKIANYERSPEYKQTVLEPESALRDTVKAIADQNETEFHTLWSALTETDPAQQRKLFNEATDGLSSADLADITDARSELKRLSRIRQNIAAEAETAWEAKQVAEAENKTQWTQADRDAHQKLARAAFVEAQERFPFLKRYEGADDWNQALDAAVARAADANLDNLEVTARAQVAVAAEVVPFLESALNNAKTRITALQEKNAEQEKQMEALRTSSPTLAGAGGDDADDPGDANKSLGTAIMEGLNLRA